MDGLYPCCIVHRTTELLREQGTTVLLRGCVEESVEMEEGSSNLEGGTTEQEEATKQLTQDHCKLSEGSPMVEESSVKIEDGVTKVEDGSSKVEVCPLKMDVASPNSKMEEGSPKTDAISLKMEVVSPKMDATSVMEISSPNMEVSSPNMDVTSPNMEEGSAKMEEVAVKMGEVSVKSEERCGNSKENIGTEQGSSKMEEVAVKMGEVSVKAEGNSNVSIEKGSVKMEEVSVKMGKVSVQSERGFAKSSEVTFKTEENSEKKVQVYRGTTCVTEGEVPDWLTVDILVRAIRNDKPGTKKPQIRPFGTPTAKTRTASHGHPTGKIQPLSRDHIAAPFNTPLVNRPSGSHLLGESSSSHLVARPSGSQSSGRPSTSQSAGKPSTSQPAGKPSTSQTSNKPSSSQSANKQSSSCGTDRPPNVPPENKATGGQSKGKSSGGRIKGKSSLSLHKGKASAGETSARTSGSSHDDKESGSSGEGRSSGSKSEGTFDDSGGSKTSEDSSRFVITENCDDKGSYDIEGNTSVVPERKGSNKSVENDVSDNLDKASDDPDKTADDSLGRNIIGSSTEDVSSKSNLESNISDSENKAPSSKGEGSSMFKKPGDPPKRTLKKPILLPKGLVKKQTDSAKETFKKPTDPPKRPVKKSGDLLKSMKRTVDPPKVRFKKPEVPPKDTLKKSTESLKSMFKDQEDSSKGTFKKPTDPPKRALKKTAAVPKKPKQPPLQIIRFISQRLSSGSTVYRVRATAVRGSVARDCHLVVKRCSNTAEVIYYKKIAPRIPYVPRVLLCDKNIVVMDDLVHEGFRRPRGKFTPAQMTVAIDGLARMHTASVVALKRDPSLMEAFPQAVKATETDIARDLRLLADRVKLWSLSDADYYAARCRALAECVPYLLERLEPADTNMTVLLHGNVLPRNVFFLYDSRNPRLPAMASFVDFANVYWGHPALDISLVTGRAGGFWEGYKIVLLSLLTRASGRMWMPQPEIKDCGETYAFALLRAVCSSVSGPAAKVLEAKLQELFPVFRQYSWLDFW